MTCGVYQILNTLSGESYVGYAWDIEERWQQHLALRSQVFHRFWPSYHLCEALNAHPIDAKSLKQGRNGVFEFFVVEACDRKLLRQRYQFWLEQLNPSYNGTNTKVKGGIVSSSQSWVYFHNLDRLQYLPNEVLLDELEQSTELRHLVFDVLYVKQNGIRPGDWVYCLIGFGGKQKQAILWNILAVEEVHRCLTPDEKLTLLIGQSQRFLTPRILASEDFLGLKASCGHFRNACRLVSEISHQRYLEELGDSMRKAQRLDVIPAYFEAFYRQVWEILEQKDLQIGCHLALIYYKQGQDLTALDLLTTILDRDGCFPQALYYRALVHLQLAHPRLAHQDLQEALVLLETRPDSEQLLAQVQALLGELDNE